MKLGFADLKSEMRQSSGLGIKTRFRGEKLRPQMGIYDFRRIYQALKCIWEYNTKSVAVDVKILLFSNLLSKAAKLY